jgi:hypothetical protein
MCATLSLHGAYFAGGVAPRECERFFAGSALENRLRSARE